MTTKQEEQLKSCFTTETDEGALLEFVINNFSVEEIYEIDDAALHEWAEKQGYKMPTESAD